MSYTGTILTTFLTNQTTPLLALPTTEFTWDTYGTLLTQTEQLLLRLYNELDTTMQFSDYALALANGSLSQYLGSYQNMLSIVETLQSQADQVSASNIPMTGGNYTRLITENFIDDSVKEAVVAYNAEPLQLSILSSNVGCPPRPPLEVDQTTDTLILHREGYMSAFSGLPGKNKRYSLGGFVEIDKIYGTPVISNTTQSTSTFQLSVGSRSPIAVGFSNQDTPMLSWVPSSYQGGIAVRLHIGLDNPSPITEVVLRGVPLLGGQTSQLLETVAAISSRSEPQNLTTHPTRAMNSNGTFTSGSDTGWTQYLTGIRYQLPPPDPSTGVRAVATDRAVVLKGNLVQKINVSGGTHYVLRYQAASPYNDPNDPSSFIVPPGAPTYGTPISSTYVCVHHYSTSTPTYGVTSPIQIDTFRDEYPVEGLGNGGWGSYVHLITTPSNAQSCILVIGTEAALPLQTANAQTYTEMAYSDVWFCDEALTQSWYNDIPAPPETNLQGPQIPQGTPVLSSNNAVPSLDVAVGNITGVFIVSDVWVTISQSSPAIEPISGWSLQEETYSTSPSLPPYSLVIANLPNNRASRDPLVLHQARYVGEGSGEWDASSQRLSGFSALVPIQRAWNSLLSRFGLWTALTNRYGARDALPYRVTKEVGAFWKLFPKYPYLKNHHLDKWISNTYPNLWSTIVNLGKARRNPISRALWLVRQAAYLINPVQASSGTASFYVYTTGLSSLELLRQEYSAAGLYMTQPMQKIGGQGAIAGEVQEVGVLLSPPLPTFGGRVRLWVVPDSNVLENSQLDTANSLLSRAIPLDSQNPRATFHSSVEQFTGIPPAYSDVATQLGYVQPAFVITPTYQNDLIVGGISPDDVANGIKLSYVPYINREAIWRVSAAMSSGSTFNPTEYDPNAIRPTVDFANTIFPALSASGTALSGSPINGIYYITGYRPIEVILTLENGSVIYPDALGSPRPGEIVYVQNEILQEATSLETQNLPASSNPYAYTPTVDVNQAITTTVDFYGNTIRVPVNTTSTQTSASPSASQTAQSNTKAFITAYAPIAGLKQGAAMTLYWHQSSQFNPISGGVITNYDVLIAPGEYNVDTTNGIIYIYSTPPGGWSQPTTDGQSGFDQILANYFYVVGSIVPQELFPQPNIAALYTPYVPYIVGEPQPLPPPPPTQPLSPQPSGSIITGQLLSANDFGFSSPFSPNNVGTTATPQINQWMYIAGPNGHIIGTPNFNPVINQHGPSNACLNTAGGFTGDPLYLDTPDEGIAQDVYYAGPGTYHFSMWTAQATLGGGFGSTPSVSDPPYITAQLILYLDDPTNPVEATDVVTIRSLSWGSPSAVHNVDGPDGTLDGQTQVYYYWPQVTSDDPSANEDAISEANITDSPGVDIGILNDGCSAVSNFTFQTPNISSDGATIPYRMRLSLNAQPDNVPGDGTNVAAVFLWADIPQYIMGCNTGYVYDSIQKLCVWQSSSSSGNQTIPTTGSNSGQLIPAPNSLSDLLQGPLQQAYPVTRNVTNYASATPTPLTQANLDPLSPSYYPIFEYVIDPGGVLYFADDLSSIGPYQGTNISIEYNYLDISPRLILEMLPEGQNVFSSPTTPLPTPLRPTVMTPQVSSIQILLNTRE